MLTFNFFDIIFFAPFGKLIGVPSGETKLYFTCLDQIKVAFFVFAIVPLGYLFRKFKHPNSRYLMSLICGLTIDFIMYKECNFKNLYLL